MPTINSAGGIGFGVSSAKPEPIYIHVWFEEWSMDGHIDMISNDWDCFYS